MASGEPSQGEIDHALYGSRRSKYNVDTSAAGKEARTCDNIVFHSIHEMKVYRDYVRPQAAMGIFSDLRFQVGFKLHTWTPGGTKVEVGTYKADFVATSRDGKPVILEAKGYKTKEYTLKKRIFEAEYGIRIQEL